jgi:hypothetical protein
LCAYRHEVKLFDRSFCWVSTQRQCLSEARIYWKISGIDCITFTSFPA